MPVRIGIVGESYLVLVFQPYQPGHRVGAGTIHADLAVVIHRHERKPWVNRWIDDGYVQSVNRVDRFPVRTRGPAQRVHAKFEVRSANSIDVYDILEIANVG